MEFKKYGKVYRVGHEETHGILEDEVVVQEKIDGANFRFYFTKSGELVFGSRTQQLTSNEGEDSNVAKHFKRVVDYVRENISPIDGCHKYIFYGEACFKHTMSYNWDSIPLFLGFDIYNIEEEKYVEWVDAEKMFQQLNLETVPTISYGEQLTAADFTDDIVGRSVYADLTQEDTKAEGIVIKNYKKQLKAKYVRDAFKEQNSKAFGGNPKYNKTDNDNAEFLFKYCTNARVEKVIMRELDGGKSLDMKLMGTVIKKTYFDIIEEEWKEILTSNWTIDFKAVRKLIAPRCRSVLESMIVNNAR